MLPMKIHGLSLPGNLMKSHVEHLPRELDYIHHGTCEKEVQFLKMYTEVLHAKLHIGTSL